MSRGLGPVEFNRLDQPEGLVGPAARVQELFRPFDERCCPHDLPRLGRNKTERALIKPDASEAEDLLRLDPPNLGLDRIGVVLDCAGIVRQAKMIAAISLGPVRARAFAALEGAAIR